MSRLSIEFECATCGQIHRVPVNWSGRYSGRLPCGKLVEVQVEPEQWRRIAESQQKKQVH